MTFGISGLNNIINILTLKAMIWLLVIVCAIAFAYFVSINVNNDE